jgi:hypothetical protein
VATPTELKRRPRGGGVAGSTQDRENGMRLLSPIVAAGALVLAGLVDPDPTLAGTPHHVRHRATTIAPRSGPAIELPPGYIRGGPLYTTCDRINRDRMLVGTCR